MKLLAILALTVLGANSFAAKSVQPTQICGAIQAEGKDLIIIRLGQKAPIYSKDKTVNKRLHQLVDFRQVCVLATFDEGDVVATKILSELE